MPHAFCQSTASISNHLLSNNSHEHQSIFINGDTHDEILTRFINAGCALSNPQHQYSMQYQITYRKFDICAEKRLHIMEKTCAVSASIWNHCSRSPELAHSTALWLPSWTNSFSYSTFSQFGLYLLFSQHHIPRPLTTNFNYLNCSVEQGSWQCAFISITAERHFTKWVISGRIGHSCS